MASVILWHGKLGREAGPQIFFVTKSGDPRGVIPWQISTPTIVGVLICITSVKSNVKRWLLDNHRREGHSVNVLHGSLDFTDVRGQKKNGEIQWIEPNFSAPFFDCFLSELKCLEKNNKPHNPQKTHREKWIFLLMKKNNSTKTQKIKR